MNHKYTSLITASALAMAATTALGQIQHDSPRQSLQIAERSMQERSGLYGAIAMAETHTKGVAIGARLSMDQSLAKHQNRQGRDGQMGGHASDRNAAERQDRDQSRQTNQPRNRDADQDRRTGQQQTRDAEQWSNQSDSLFAIVTCVVDRTKVRDVIVDMKTNTVIGVHAASYGSSARANYGDERNPSEYRDDSGDYSSASGAGGFARATDLMNVTVRNESNVDLGDIDELAIDPDSNRVVYGVLRRGGFLGMGESRYAIPTSRLTSPQNGRIVLDLNESDFETISGFDNNNWPTKAEPKLSKDRTAQTNDAPAAKRIVKASKIIGSDVECRDRNDLGEISDLVVEPHTGRVLYAIVKSDRGYMPVPMAALRKSGQNYSLPMTMDQLRSMPKLDANRDTNWGDEGWNRRIHESYGTKFEMASARDNR